MKILDEVLNKSEKERKKIAVISSFSITAVVFLGWMISKDFVSLGGSDSKVAQTVESQNLASVSTAVGPIDSAKVVFKSAADMISDQISSIKNIFKSSGNSGAESDSSGLQIYSN